MDQEGWITPSMLANLKLAGMPGSKENIIDRARREGWTIRPVGGREWRRGVGLEIEIATMGPIKDAVELALNVSKLAAVEGDSGGHGRPPSGPLSEPEAAASSPSAMASPAEIEDAKCRWTRAKEGQLGRARKAHAAVLMVHEILKEDVARRERSESVIGNMAAYEAAAIKVYCNLKRKKSVERAWAKVQRFEKALWLMALVDKKSDVTNATEIEGDPELQKIILDTALHSPNSLYEPSSRKLTVSVPQILADVKEHLPDRTITRRQVRYFLKEKWLPENHALVTAITNPKEFNNRCRTAVGKLPERVSRPNEEVVADFSPADIELLRDGRKVRVGILKDRFTRQIQLRACDGGPCADDTAEMLIRWILERGHIETFVADNGKEFANEQVWRGLETISTLRVLNLPYSPWAKGDIERSIGTVQRRIARLAGATGANVAVRQQLRERLSMADRRGLDDREILGVALTFEQFKAELQRIEGELNDAFHRDLGMSPNQFRAQYIGRIQRFDDELTLRMVFKKGDFRVVGKEGVEWENVFFWRNGLIPFMGRRVFAVETGDLGLLAILTEDRKELICIAENPERLGKDRHEMAILAQAAQRRFVAEGRKILSAVRRKIRARVVADAINKVEDAAPAGACSRLLSHYPTPQAAAAAVAARALQEAGTHSKSAPPARRM